MKGVQLHLVSRLAGAQQPLALPFPQVACGMPATGREGGNRGGEGGGDGGEDAVHTSA